MKSGYKDKTFFSPLYLNNKGTKHNSTEDGVVKNALKDIPFAMDLAGVDLIEELHHDKSVEDNGVVFRGWCMKGCVPAAVNIEHFLPCRTVTET